jgi:hypothetical protein
MAQLSLDPGYGTRVLVAIGVFSLFSGAFVIAILSLFAILKSVWPFV